MRKDSENTASDEATVGEIVDETTENEILEGLDEETRKKLSVVSKDKGEIVGESGLTGKQVALLHRTILKGLEADEMGLAFFKAKAIGANIFAGDLKAYKDSKGNLLFVISRDFLKNKALENPDFLIANANAVYENDEFEVIDLAKGELKHGIKYAFDKEKRGKVVGAWCIGYTRSGEKTAFLADIDEYDPHMKSELVPWNRNKPAMIVKCAEAVIYKRFARLTDVYTIEEVEHVVNRENKEIDDKPKKPNIKKLTNLTGVK